MDFAAVMTLFSWSLLTVGVDPETCWGVGVFCTKVVAQDVSATVISKKAVNILYLFIFPFTFLPIDYRVSIAAGAVKIQENFARSGLINANPTDNRKTTGIIKLDSR